VVGYRKSPSSDQSPGRQSSHVEINRSKYCNLVETLPWSGGDNNRWRAVKQADVDFESYYFIVDYELYSCFKMQYALVDEVLSIS